MSYECLPLDLLVSAQTRLAARDGIPMIVRRRGDTTNGTIILKVNLLNGQAMLYAQVRDGDELVWSPSYGEDPLDDADAERMLESQAAIDPDSWLIEVEDKQGRLWFPGRVVSF